MATGYGLEWSKKAFKYRETANASTRERIDKAIKIILKDPLGRESVHIKPLKGSLKGKHRYDIGGIRIIYEIFEGKLVILIADIGPRGDIYK